MSTKKPTKKTSKKRNYPVVIYNPKQSETLSESTKSDKSNWTIFPVVAVTPPLEFNEPDVTFPYVNTNKPLKPYENLYDLISDFESDLIQIRILGEKIFEEDIFFQKREQARAIYALSKILGVYNKYFKDASESEYSALMHTLRLKFQVRKNSKTTPFHLLSRQYRGNDTKQASADAKILILADKLGKDENNFSTWIFECKGLREAKNLSDEHSRQERNLKKSSAPKKLGPKAIFEKMNDSFIGLIRAKQAHRVFTINKVNMPEFFGAIKPWSGQNVGMIGVHIADNSMNFYQLLPYVPQFGDYQTEVPDVKEDPDSE